MKSLFLCAFLVLAIGCNSTKGKKDAQQDNSLTDGSYSIAQIKGTDVSSENLTFIVSDAGQKIGGFSGCNRYFGSVNPEGSDALFSGMGSTKMYCNSKMDTENMYLEEMKNVASVSLKGNSLLMNNTAGETIITAVKE